MGRNTWMTHLALCLAVLGAARGAAADADRPHHARGSLTVSAVILPRCSVSNDGVPQVNCARGVRFELKPATATSELLDAASDDARATQAPLVSQVYF